MSETSATTRTTEGEAGADLASAVADIRKVPMQRLVETRRDLIAATLRRIVPDTSATCVPVASAFNSSI